MRFIYLGIVVWVVLTVFVAVFAASANPREIRVLNKGIWILIILFVPIFGAILYLIQGRPLGGSTATTSLAPDDDPDFLRRLADRLKNKDPKKDDDKDA